MSASSVSVLDDTALGDFPELIASWRRHLVAQRMSPATLQTYGAAARQLARFLAAEGMPTAVANVTQEHLEAFITDLLGRWKLRPAGCTP